MAENIKNVHSNYDAMTGDKQFLFSSVKFSVSSQFSVELVESLQREKRNECQVLLC